MANLFNVNKFQIRLLDSGAGTGILIAAFCSRLVKRFKKKLELVVDAYENDVELIPLLKATLKECRNELKKKKYLMKFFIHKEDFLLHNARYLKKARAQTPHNEDYILYDVIISNPPYYKLKKDSPQSLAVKELIYGQPNIYAMFLALAVSMLKDKGEMVFITPRSFCSGLYYKKFREWFLDNAQLTKIHIFESRKGVFSIDNVLQENIIIKAVKNSTESATEIDVSSCKDKSFKNLEKIKFKSTDLVYRKNGDIFIRIPKSPLDLKVLHMIDKWPNTLNDLGLEISTGPVVPFRAKKYLRHEFNVLTDVPLLWMHNIKDIGIKWPVNKNNKEKAIINNEYTHRILLLVKNYVLLKRLSSKEQKRRLYAAVLLEKDFKKYGYIGVENHINYIHKPNGVLSEHEVYGIAAILNTSIIDSYFKTLNGNTQVNAVDIRNLPFPPIKKIRELGTAVKDKKPNIDYELDIIFAKILNVDPDIIKHPDRMRNNLEKNR